MTLDGGNGSLFLNVATPEINRRTDAEVAAVNAASAASNGFVAIAPDGTAIRSLLYSGAKTERLPARPVRASTARATGPVRRLRRRVGSGDGPRVGYSAGSGRCRIAFVRERRAF